MLKRKSAHGIPLHLFVMLVLVFTYFISSKVSAQYNTKMHECIDRCANASSQCQDNCFEARNRRRETCDGMDVSSLENYKLRTKCHDDNRKEAEKCGKSCSDNYQVCYKSCGVPNVYNPNDPIHNMDMPSNLVLSASQKRKWFNGCMKMVPDCELVTEKEYMLKIATMWKNPEIIKQSHYTCSNVDLGGNKEASVLCKDERSMNCCPPDKINCQSFQGNLRIAEMHIAPTTGNASAGDWLRFVLENICVGGADSPDNGVDFQVDVQADGYKKWTDTLSVKDYTPSTITLKGRIENEAGEPVSGAVISIQGLSETAVSDKNGAYNLQANSNGTKPFTLSQYDIILSKSNTGPKIPIPQKAPDIGNSVKKILDIAGKLGTTPVAVTIISGNTSSIQPTSIPLTGLDIEIQNLDFSNMDSTLNSIAPFQEFTNDAQVTIDFTDNFLNFTDGVSGATKKFTNMLKPIKNAMDYTKNFADSKSFLDSQAKFDNMDPNDKSALAHTMAATKQTSGLALSGAVPAAGATDALTTVLSWMQPTKTKIEKNHTFSGVDVKVDYDLGHVNTGHVIGNFVDHSVSSNDGDFTGVIDQLKMDASKVKNGSFTDKVIVHTKGGVVFTYNCATYVGSKVYQGTSWAGGKIKGAWNTIFGN